MSDSRITYAIADDHKLFREGLRQVLGNYPILQFMAEASDGAELLEKIHFEQPDAILLDLEMKGMGGREAMKEIRARYPHVKILILTMSEEPQIALELMKDGANGYLLKNADPGEVVLALRVCMEKGNYVNDYVDNILLNAVKSDKVTRVVGKVALNDRELEVLKLICEGLTAVQIGERIFLSPRTVEGLRSSLMEKTGARNVAGLVMYAVKNGVVT